MGGKGFCAGSLYVLALGTWACIPTGHRSPPGLPSSPSTQLLSSSGSPQRQVLRLDPESKSLIWEVSLEHMCGGWAVEWGEKA